ncbi:hypothetical protein [Cohnella sp. WQ 127256]|uniref:hypothetical protein n=1 Tax=Cohnella sp. WQ 127256 TaxID=2938790 RepID=UPI0021176FA2|nr:hypothetical protein [Cohnella sp. WQ 127256]
MISFILNLLFYQRSNSPFSSEENTEFEDMYIKSIQNTGIINYQSEFPKYRFIDYLIQEKSFVAHGSNNKDIELFETRKQTLYNGEFVNAIFATKDGIWSIFYATLDRSKVVNNFRNACLKTLKNKKYYFFSLTKKTLDKDPWTSGMIYLLSSELFEQTNKTRVHFDEWISKQEIKPVLRLDVSKDDFEYINKISTHKSKESIITTWLLYKVRTSILGHTKRTGNFR